MRWKLYGLYWVLPLIVLGLAGCGGNSSSMSPSSSSSQSQPQGSMGSVVLFGGDAALCDVMSFQATITGATLTPQGATSGVSILPAGTSMALDFARLMDFTTVLTFSSVPAGTYTQLTLTLSDPRIIVLNSGGTSPTTVSPISATLSVAAVSIPINPPLVVPANGTVSLRFDFNMAKSLVLNAQGQVTGAVNPFISIIPESANEQELGDVDDLHGIVQSVTTSGLASGFSGALQLAVARANGTTQSFTVYTTNSTVFPDSSGLSGLQAGMFIEIDGFVNNQGQIVATEVEIEDLEGGNRAGFTGIVLSVTRDAAGHATQFTMMVDGEFPDVRSTIPVYNLVTVNVQDSTRFKIAFHKDNEANLSFDATTLGVGQDVVVHGTFQGGGPPQINARSIFLRRQTIRGTFNTLLAAGSDNKTGAFSMAPCTTALRGQTLNVLTFPTTAFANVSGLNGLSGEISTRGLLLYEQVPVSANGANLTPPAYVEEAHTVRELP